MLYSCMLVDDEEDVISAIRQTIDWESLGFSVPREAHNGIEALEFAEESAPDVVLTDIKMPYMDGLELAHKLKELYPNIRIIVFSGFDEFEYAREALRLEAEEYMLKPVHAAELSKLFLRIRESLDTERAERQNREQLQAYYEKSLPRLRESFFVSLLDGKIPEEEIARQAEDYQLELGASPCAAAVIHTGSAGLPDGVSAVMIAASVRRLAEESLGQRFHARFFGYLGNTVMLAELGETEQLRFLTDACDRFCRLAAAKLGATVTIGVGKVCAAFHELRDSYTGARNALSYRMIYGTGKAISISEIAPQEKNGTDLSERESMQDIFRKMRMEKEEELSAAIARYIAENAAAQASVQEYRFFVMETAGELYRFAKDNALSAEEIFGDNDAMYRILQQLEPGELTRWMDEVCRKMREMIQHKRADSARSFAARAIDYVNEHYAEGELTVDAMCSHLNVSAAYFSTIFKRETGKTFVQYLTDLRMEKAVELLLSTSEKTYMIARKVGYADPNYFSYVFKKQFGMSPSKYKDSRGSEA